MYKTITSFPDLFKSNFIRLPKPLIQLFGLETTLFLSELFSEYQYWFKRKQLSQNHSFYSTVENVFNNTGLSRHVQEKASKQLEKYGLIKKTHYGMPAKRYFSFETDGIKKLLSDIQQLNKNTVEIRESKQQEQTNIPMNKTPSILSVNNSTVNVASVPMSPTQPTTPYHSPNIIRASLTAEDLGRTPQTSKKYKDFMFY